MVGKRKTKRRVAEIIQREDGEYDCISANQHVMNMLAISVAIKLADAARRILMYTKGADTNKGFYAICRGIFPIHELCGAMIAIALAKRDLLGMDVPRWKILAPAIVVHAMANFRGKRVRSFYNCIYSNSYSLLRANLTYSFDFTTLSRFLNGVHHRLGQRCSFPH